jgi:hypothetical protein
LFRVVFDINNPCHVVFSVFHDASPCMADRFPFLGGPDSFSNSGCHASKGIDVADVARCKIPEELGKTDAQQSGRT